MLGRVLFSGDDVDKTLEALSGGEAARLVFSRLMVQQPNVLVLDEPTNHLDLEAIEALVSALKQYDGTLLFVSHDRWFVDALATRVVEITKTGLVDFHGTYSEFLERAGDDHLDAEQVAQRAKAEQREKRRGGASAPPPAGAAHGAQKPSDPDRGLSNEERRRRANQRKALPRRRDDLIAQIERAEAKKAELEARYAEPGFFESTSRADQDALRREQAVIESRLDLLMDQWEAVEAELAELSRA